jgi:hypothetical protein
MPLLLWHVMTVVHASDSWTLERKAYYGDVQCAVSGNWIRVPTYRSNKMGLYDPSEHFDAV